MSSSVYLSYSSSLVIWICSGVIVLTTGSATVSAIVSCMRESVCSVSVEGMSPVRDVQEHRIQSVTDIPNPILFILLIQCILRFVYEYTLLKGIILFFCLKSKEQICFFANRSRLSVILSVKLCQTIILLLWHAFRNEFSVLFKRGQNMNIMYNK